MGAKIRFPVTMIRILTGPLLDEHADQQIGLVAAPSGIGHAADQHTRWKAASSSQNEHIAQIDLIAPAVSHTHVPLRSEHLRSFSWICIGMIGEQNGQHAELHWMLVSC